MCSLPLAMTKCMNAMLKGDGGMIGMTETQCPKALDACIFCSGPHAGWILGQTFGTQVLLSQVSWTESSIQEICPVSRMP